MFDCAVSGLNRSALEVNLLPAHATSRLCYPPTVDLFILPLLAFLAAIALHLVALKVFPLFGLLDFPQRYGLTRKRLPYPSGVLAVIVLLLLSPLLLPASAQATGLIIAVTILAVTSVIDDRSGLSPPLRLAVQLSIGVVIYLSGTRIYSLTNPLDAWMPLDIIPLDSFVIESALFSNPSLIGIFFTVIWFFLTINAFNWLDGIPGHVSILSTIGNLTIGLLALSERVNQPELALLCFVMAAVSLACALFDLPRLVVLGDTGAMFFGLMLGVVTIYAGGKVATAFLVLGVPIIDSFLVILRRITTGRSPLKGSATGEHLHHRLLEAGWKPWHVTLLTTLIGTGFGVTALFLSTFEKLLAAGLLFMLMICVSLYADRKRMSKIR